MTEDPVGETSPPSSSDAAGIPSGATGAGGATPVKADLGKRFIAAIIDAIIAVVVGFIPLVGGLAATAYWLVRDGMELDFMDRRSIGKRLVKIRPVRLDGAPMDLTTSMKRNWMFALGGIAQLLAFTIIGIVLAIPLGLSTSRRKRPHPCETAPARPPAGAAGWAHRARRNGSPALPSWTFPDRFFTRRMWVVSARCAKIG